MGRRKAQQKNTLAQWAGVKSSDEVAIPGRQCLILKFKIDKHKLSRHQARLGHTGPGHAERPEESCFSDQGTEVDFETTGRSTGLHDNNDIDTPKPEPHPFFSLAKRRPQTESKADLSDAKTLPVGDTKSHSNDTRGSSTTIQGTHGFFKPHNTSNVTESQADFVKLCKRPLRDALLPCKDTMLVEPSTSSSVASVDAPLPIPRRRHTKDAATCTSEDWHGAEWENMSRSILRRANNPFVTTRQRSRAMPESQDRIRHHCASRDHGALHAMTDRRQDPRKLTGDERAKLWTQRYAPCSASEVLQNGSEAFVLRDWLQSRKLHNRARLDYVSLSRRTEMITDKYADERDDFIIDDDFEALLTSDLGAEFDSEHDFPCPPGREMMFKSNLVVVSGPTGCGKSAAIQAVASELNFEIFEVNSTDRRNGKDIVEKVGEAAQSQMVNKQRAPDGQQSRSLILFEEVDVLYRDDKDFWSAVLSLVTTSKRPILLTCNDLSALPRQLQIPSIFLEFSPPSTVLATDYLQALSIMEGIDTALTRVVIAEQVRMCNHDLRATINALQFLNLSELFSCSRSMDSIAEELMAKEVSISMLYRSTETGSATKVSKSSFEEYARNVDNLSVVDLFAAQQRSCALESIALFENEVDDGPARPSEKDDLVGNPIISEPLGRYTRLHPGDSNLALALAFEIQGNITSNLKSKFPIWSISQDGRILLTDKTENYETWHLQAMVRACEPFAVPENWMYDYAGHNSIDRPRLSGILASDVTPYLREMANLEEARTSWERSMMDSHSGRMTRNTMSSEFGLKRQAKIPESLRAAITATNLRSRMDCK